MPTALIINPNTSRWMTTATSQSAGQVLHPPWEFRVATATGGSPSIESWFEAGLAAVGLLNTLRENADVDGIVLACFGDPGLFAVREVVQIPVVGIAEASFLTACMLGFRFGVLGGSTKDIPWMETLLWTYGLEKRCAGIWPMESDLGGEVENTERFLANLEEASSRLVRLHAEVIILGCAGWGKYRQDLQARSGIPFIDPVEAGCSQLRSIVEMNLSTSRAGMFERIRSKEVSGLDTILAPGLASWVEGLFD